MPLEDGVSVIPYTRPNSRDAGVAEEQKRQTLGEKNERQTSSTAIYNPYYTGRPRAPVRTASKDSVDRWEIIRRIKEREAVEPNVFQDLARRPPSSSNMRKRKSPSPPRLLPSPDMESKHQVPTPMTPDWAASGMAISRPRSALHRGDFNGKSTPDTGQDASDQRPQHLHRDPHTLLSTSPVAPWHRDFPSLSASHSNRPFSDRPLGAIEHPARPRTFSHVSVSGSFTYQPPTSPLVHQANAADIPDYGNMRNRPPSPGKNRRHTFSPHSSTLDDQCSSSPRPYALPSMRKEATFPYQAHQPRRSITFNSLPQTPGHDKRRLSVSGGSPVQRSMVGSFEESILRGRMSSTPSQPLHFTAQIGVLGKGDCKPSLRCPPHALLPCEAHFYSYGTGSAIADSQPSPYVGTIDLEKQSGLPKARERKRYVLTDPVHQTVATMAVESQEEHIANAEMRKRRKQKQKRRSHSPMDTPTGAYRIPARGQLQIVIKNPHKTAVKLFLIPYDVSDIQPGQKTFIRQRSYSAGPIIDMPLDARKNLGTDRPEASIGATGDPQDKPTLRYLIHLHICCPSRGRIYLYKSIRVVFANRVPDGKERLRNEIQLPNPRYSVYKPSRDSNVGLLGGENDSRRHSAVDIEQPGIFSNCDRYPVSNPSMPASSFPSSGAYRRETAPSFRFPQLDTVDSRPASRGVGDMDVDADVDHVIGSPPSPFSPLAHVDHVMDDSSSLMTFSRSSSQERPSMRTESLLSQRLRDLEMKGRQHGV